MTELYFAFRVMAAEPEPLYLGMPLPLALGVIGLIGATVTAVVAAVSKKWRTPADDREDKKIGIEADERLLKRFQDEIGRLEGRIVKVEGELEELRSERVHFIDWIYAAVHVARTLGFLDKLPNPPKGVTIADHPSAWRNADANTGGTK